MWRRRRKEKERKGVISRAIKASRSQPRSPGHFPRQSVVTRESTSEPGTRPVNLYYLVTGRVHPFVYLLLLNEYVTVSANPEANRKSYCQPLGPSHGTAKYVGVSCIPDSRSAFVFFQKNCQKNYRSEHEHKPNSIVSKPSFHRHNNKRRIKKRKDKYGDD